MMGATSDHIVEISTSLGLSVVTVADAARAGGLGDRHLSAESGPEVLTRRAARRSTHQHVCPVSRVGSAAVPPV